MDQDYIGRTARGRIDIYQSVPVLGEETTGQPSRATEGAIARFAAVARRPSMLALMDQAIVSGASFLTTVAIGRFADAEQLGVYSLGISGLLMVLALQMSLMTTPYAVQHHGARDNAKIYAGSTLIMQLSLVLVMCVGLLVGAVLNLNLRILLLAMLFAAPFLMLREFARRMAYAGLSVATALAIDLPVVVLQLTALAALGFTGTLSAKTAFIALGSAAVVGVAIGVVSLRRHFQFRRNLIASDLQRSWRFGRWIAGSQLLDVINTQGAFWLIAIVLGTASTGVYAACLAIVLLCNPFMLAVGNILTPRAAETFANRGRDALRRLIHRAAGILAIAMALYCLILAMGGNWLARAIYGDEYGSHGLLILILGLSFFASAITMAFTDGIRALGRSDIEFKTMALDALLTIGLGVMGLITFGLIGLASASLAGSIAALVLQATAFTRLNQTS